MSAHLHPSRNDAPDYSSQDRLLFTVISIYSVLFSQKAARLRNPFKDVNSEGVFVAQMHQSINRPRKESVFEMCTCNLIQSARVMTLPLQIVRVKPSHGTTMVFLQNTHGLK